MKINTQSQLGKLIKLTIMPRALLYTVAKKYVKLYEGFNYKFERNGEAKLLDLLADLKISTVFDVGANVGEWSEVASKKFPNANIHTFELSERTFETLRSRHRENKRIILNNFGLSDMSGEFRYRDYGLNSGANSLITDSSFHEKMVQSELIIGKLKTGKQYCQQNGINEIDLLKVDVEGAEHLVLQGFEELLQSGKIKVIQFEYGYTNGDAHFLIKDFYKLLERNGYIVGPLKPNGVIFMDFDYALNDFNSGPNFVAVNKKYEEIINRVKGRPIVGYPSI